MYCPIKEAALLFYLAVLAQGAQAQGFVNTYGGAGAQDGIGVLPHGGGFAVGFRSFDPAQSTHTANVLSVASDGSLLSTDLIEEVEGNAFVQAMAAATDGALFLAGSVIPAGRTDHDALLVKRLADGTVAWVAAPTSTAGDEQYFAVASLPDGGAVCGGVLSLGSGHDGWVTRFAADGTVVWSVSEGGPLDEEVHGIAVNGTDIMLTGRQMNFGGTSDAWFGLLNWLDGSVQWTTSWGGTGNETGRAIVPRGPGEFLMAGTTNSYGTYDQTEHRIKQHVYLVAIDLIGDTLWTRSLGDTLADRGGWALSVAGNGDAIVTGERWELPGESDALAYRVSSAGTIIWERTWDLGKEERLLSVQALADGFITTGWAFDPFARQITLIRRDPNGN